MAQVIISLTGDARVAGNILKARTVIAHVELVNGATPQDLDKAILNQVCRVGVVVEPPKTLPMPKADDDFEKKARKPSRG